MITTLWDAVYTQQGNAGYRQEWGVEQDIGSQAIDRLRFLCDASAIHSAIKILEGFNRVAISGSVPFNG